jgi:rare lipoprotein A (peptidoglycan hydrolase)
LNRFYLLLGILTFTAPVQARTVTATVYHPDFNGQPDYCTGKSFRYWGISAAHPWIRCGTLVTVTHRGRSLVVPITDRCDCNSIDLSAGAAYRLRVPLDGVAEVGISY